MTSRSFLRNLSLPLFLASSLPAGAQSFGVGTNAINAGIGLGGYRYAYLGRGGSYAVAPSLAFSFERGITELGPGVLGIGGFFAHKGVRSRYTTSSIVYDERWSNMVIGARGSWHWNSWHGNDKLDLYAGLMLGYNIGGYRNRSTHVSSGVPYDPNYNYSLSFVTYSTYVGARYLFTERFGVYGELGYGISFINGGLTFVF